MKNKSYHNFLKVHLMNDFLLMINIILFYLLNNISNKKFNKIQYNRIIKSTLKIIVFSFSFSGDLYSDLIKLICHQLKIKIKFYFVIYINLFDDIYFYLFYLFLFYLCLNSYIFIFYI